MDNGEWQRFLQSGQRSERTVGRLSAFLCGYLSPSSREVRIGHDYVRKAVEKHGLRSEDLSLMRRCLDHGEAYHDRARHITLLHFDDQSARWLQLTVKCCTEHRRLYVVTFHGMGADDVARKRKRYQRVWPVEN